MKQSDGHQFPHRSRLGAARRQASSEPPELAKARNGLAVIARPNGFVDRKRWLIVLEAKVFDGPNRESV